MPDNDPRPGSGTVPTPTPDNAKAADADTGNIKDSEDIEKQRDEKKTDKAIPVNDVNSTNDVT